jgi:hypothetical protein
MLQRSIMSSTISHRDRAAISPWRIGTMSMVAFAF